MIETFMSKRVLHFLIIFHFNKTALNFLIAEINGLPERKLFENFKNKVGNKYSNIVGKIQKDYNDNDIINDIDDINPKKWNALKDLNEENTKYRKKILVKRIIPHGIAPTGLEYDHKFNTVYKPLVRVHKTKPFMQVYDEIRSNKYDKNLNSDWNQKVINSVLDKIEPRYKKIKAKKTIHDTNEDLLEPFKRSDDFNDDNDKTYKLIKQIQKRIKGIKCKSKRLKAYDKVIGVLNNILRSPQFEKSGEANDPLAPGKIMLPEDKEEVNEKPKKWIPHYPPWNYWTYKKTIHEDVCPGTQVKIGNMCIWTPPH